MYYFCNFISYCRDSVSNCSVFQSVPPFERTFILLANLMVPVKTQVLIWR